jgi:hypothetical protein
MTTLPKCEIGRVINYAYLWKREQLMGRDDGRKTRPCAIVGMADKDGKTVAYVMPITHTPPLDPARAIEIPHKVRHHLGLDEQKSWLMCDEVNVFTWPGFDVCPTPHGQVSYGVMPPGLFKAAKEKFAQFLQEKHLKIVPRDAPVLRTR